MGTPSGVVTLCEGFKVVNATLRGSSTDAGAASTDCGLLEPFKFCVFISFAVCTEEDLGCSVVKFTLRGCAVVETVAVAAGGEIKGIGMEVCCWLMVFVSVVGCTVTNPTLREGPAVP